MQIRRNILAQKKAAHLDMIREEEAEHPGVSFIYEKVMKR
jgi:hypothetical protein